MSDLIDRQAAINSLHMHLMYRMGTDSNKKRLDDWINNLPSAQTEQRWIPVSEKVPMVSGEFLVTLTDEDGEWVSTAEWNTTFGGRWQDIFIDDGYRDISNVIAWMPLPEPYREEGEQE